MMARPPTPLTAPALGPRTLGLLGWGLALSSFWALSMGGVACSKPPAAKSESLQKSEPDPAAQPAGEPKPSDSAKAVRPDPSPVGAEKVAKQPAEQPTEATPTRAARAADAAKPAAAPKASDKATATGPGACKVDKDCQLRADYCGGCNCRSDPSGHKPGKCPTKPVSCLVNPCDGRRAVCSSGRCTVAGSGRNSPE